MDQTWRSHQELSNGMQRAYVYTILSRFQLGAHHHILGVSEIWKLYPDFAFVTRDNIEGLLLNPKIDG